jgi:hypothetical protein
VQRSFEQLNALIELFDAAMQDEILSFQRFDCLS